jgi:hypothetical protein
VISTATPPPEAWTPQRDEARRLVQDELASPEYAEAEPNPILEWLGEVFQAFVEWLDSLGGAAPSLPGWILPVILVAVAVVVLLLVRPRANAAARSRRSAAVLSDRTITPDEHRRTAQVAFSAGRHSEALAAWFRALVRQAEERTILVTRPGRTASDAAHALGTVFPAERPGLAAAADGFNAVLYGEQAATAEQAATVRDLDARLQRASLGDHGRDMAPDNGSGRDLGTAHPVAPR